MERLVSLIEKAGYCVVLTGAGVSTFSGIPDFRGDKGVYSSAGFDPDLIFSLEHFHKEPSYFYRHSREFIYGLHEKRPGIIHEVLAGLEAQGLVKSVVTQNIDMLHGKAGSRRVIEIHGSPRKHVCLGCGGAYDYDAVVRMLDDCDVPLCDCGGVIKPQITFYGEMLDPDALGRAVRESSKADLLLVLGSTLLVQPAASLPLYTLDSGGKMVIVNNQPTPLDGMASLRYRDLATVFQRLGRDLLTQSKER